MEYDRTIVCSERIFSKKERGMCYVPKSHFAEFSKIAFPLHTQVIVLYLTRDKSYRLSYYSNRCVNPFESKL